MPGHCTATDRAPSLPVTHMSHPHNRHGGLCSKGWRLSLLSHTASALQALFPPRSCSASTSQSLRPLSHCPRENTRSKHCHNFSWAFNFHLLSKQICIFNKHQTKYNKILMTNTCKCQCFPVPSSAQRFQGRQHEYPSVSDVLFLWQLLDVLTAPSETLALLNHLNKAQWAMFELI